MGLITKVLYERKVQRMLSHSSSKALHSLRANTVQVYTWLQKRNYIPSPYMRTMGKPWISQSLNSSHFWKSLWKSYQMPNITAMPLVDTYPENCVPRKKETSTAIHFFPLFTKARKLNQLRFSSADESIRKMWCM